MEKNRIVHSSLTRRVIDVISLKMKLLTIFIFAGSMALSASSYSQKTRIDLQLENSTLTEILNTIEKKSEFIFIYNANVVNADVKRSISVKVEQIEKILELLFQGTDITYRIDDRQVFLSKKNDMKNPEQVNESIFSDQVRKREISGTIKDSKGQPMPGTTVMVKGTTIGTITDADGHFTLNIPGDAKILAVSFVGMISQELTIGSQTTFNIVMAEVPVDVGEVVVVGYGTQKKLTVTGAVSALKGSELLKSPVANLTSALVGRVSGVIGVQQNGQPGKDETILRIRGIGTLTSSVATPLVLVDGIERSFSQIDPNEIESFSVLKDASSTAVYGIRGANGVIIVTTKKGTEGKAIVSYTGNTSVQSPTRLPKYLDAYNFSLIYNEALKNDNPLTTQTFTDAELQKFKDQSDPLFYPNTNWLKLLIKEYAPQTQHNLNIRGGTKNVKYFVSLGYLNQTGLIKEFQQSSGISNNNNFSRYNFRSNIDINVTPTTTVNFQLGGYSSVRHSSQITESDAGANTTLMSQILVSAPNATIGMYDGKIITLDRSGNKNAIANLAAGFADYTDNSLNINLGINQKLDMITKGLSVRGKIAFDNFYDLRRVFSRSTPTYTPLKVYPNGVETTVFRQNGELGDFVSGPSTGFARSRQLYMDWALEYNNSFGRHNVGALVLYNQKKRWYHSLAYPGIPLGYQDWVGRVTYNYALRYLLEFNMGRNGSENFPVNSRFGWFPAISAGWVVTSEPAVEKLIGKNILSYLKIRGSYGQVGNDIMGSTRFMYYPSEYLQGGSGVFGEDPVRYGSYTEGKLGNPDVTWERSKKLDVAVETRFFKDQLSFLFDYFSEDRNNILTTRKTVPSYVAVTLSDAYNIGHVKNKGYEIEAGWDSKIKDFNYNFHANYAFARNKILYMDEALNDQYPNLNRTGHRVGETFGYIFEGFYNTPDEVASAPSYFGGQPTLGDNKYKDITGDGVINAYDQQALKSPAFPEITYGISAACSYKGVDISILFQGNANVSVPVQDQFYRPFYMLGTALEMVQNRWHLDSPDNNAHATFPKPSVTYARGQNFYNSTLNIYDGSYFRFKNLEIGYTFNKQQLKRLRLESIRLSLSGQNLYTWDKLKILDPESIASASNQYPQCKVYNVGIKVQF
jgi:TonB-linked SusC/RagA family outer membrane protein